MHPMTIAANRIREAGPLATPDEVRAIACRTCGAAAGEPCDGSKKNWFMLGVIFVGFGRIHTRRYLDLTGDKR